MATKRRRKNGPRHKNGHLKRMPIEDSPRTIAARMPHRKGIGPDPDVLDHRYESELGRMVLREEIEPEQATAGEIYERLWRGYVATLQGPPWPGRGAGVPPCRGCESAEERRHCLCNMRKRIYLEAADVLFYTGGGAAVVVQGVAIYDRPCPCGSLSVLKRGLGALARHFGLDNSRKRI